MNQVDPIKAFVLTLVSILTLPLSCLTMLASTGCGADMRTEGFRYFQETKGEGDVQAATDGRFSFFFGTELGFRVPFTATGHVKNNPYAMPAKKEEPVKQPVPGTP